jgi:hypothetical protein
MTHTRPSAVRLPSKLSGLSRDGVFIRTVPLGAADLAYLRPFRPPVRSRPAIGPPSRAACPDPSVKDAAVFRSCFGRFGFFGSRFDRLCPFAIAGSFYC